MEPEDVELGSIEREIYVDAPPDVVFDVVSRPEHVAQWWPDEAHYDVEVGGDGEIVFADPEAGGAAVALSVVEVEPPSTFSFRWTHPAGTAARAGNSLLVTFALSPQGAGTRLRMTETGFREMGWEVAVLEQQYAEHVTGWDHFLPRLTPYAESLGVRP